MSKEKGWSMNWQKVVIEHGQYVYPSNYGNLLPLSIQDEIAFLTNLKEGYVSTSSSCDTFTRSKYPVSLYIVLLQTNGTVIRIFAGLANKQAIERSPNGRAKKGWNYVYRTSLLTYDTICCSLTNDMLEYLCTPWSMSSELQDRLSKNVKSSRKFIMNEVVSFTTKL